MGYVFIKCLFYSERCFPFLPKAGLLHSGLDPMYDDGYTEVGPSEAPGWNPKYEASFTEDGTFEAPGFYEPELQMDPGYESGHGGQDTSYESGHGGQDPAAVASQHFTPTSPQGTWNDLTIGVKLYCVHEHFLTAPFFAYLGPVSLMINAGG